MAITCTLAVSPEGVQAGQPTEATATVANSGGADVTVTLAELFVSPYSLTDGSVSVAKGELKPVVGNVMTVPAGGSLTLKAKVIPFASSPATGVNAAEAKFSVDARVWTSDGSVADADAVILTQLDFANEAQRAVLDFSQLDRSALSAVGVM